MPFLVARHGAGAEKCPGPAPGRIINKLNIRNLSLQGGAGRHEKTAPAPFRQPTCTIQAVRLRHSRFQTMIAATKKSPVLRRPSADGRGLGSPLPNE